MAIQAQEPEDVWSLVRVTNGLGLSGRGASWDLGLSELELEKSWETQIDWSPWVPPSQVIFYPDKGHSLLWKWWTPKKCLVVIQNFSSLPTKGEYNAKGWDVKCMNLVIAGESWGQVSATAEDGRLFSVALRDFQWPQTQSDFNYRGRYG